MIESLQNILIMNLFPSFKTGNLIIDAIITGMMFSVAGYVMSIYNNIELYSIWDSIMQVELRNCFKKEYSIILSGDSHSIINDNMASARISNTFTNTMKALLNHISTHRLDNNNITNIKEILLQSETDDKNGDYLISQKRRFVVDEDLRIYGRFVSSSQTNDAKTVSVRTESITLILTSIHTTVSSIKQFCKRITSEYLDNIESSRNTKKFIYSMKSVRNDEYYLTDAWSEHDFQSSRTFDNLFFEGKIAFMKKFDFFLENKDWYYEKGIPYTLGIGLYGPPGTGKTSLIKSIANYTGRHVVVLSLKMLKTRSQLNRFFYEMRYSLKNRADSITFDKKIIVIEDIDCIGDLVKKRQVVDAKTVVDDKNDDKPKPIILKLEDEPVTLDDILNIMDGICENTGRILIITSNFYDELDDALVRPGRIDVKMELTYVSKQTFSDIYKHLFHTKISASDLRKFTPGELTPAEIINNYISSNYDKTAFIQLCLKKKSL